MLTHAAVIMRDVTEGAMPVIRIVTSGFKEWTYSITLEQGNQNSKSRRDIMFKRAWIIFSFVALLLAGCGGGGSNSFSSAGTSSGTNTAVQAQGIYSGTTSTDDTFYSIVLPNDKIYAVYGTTSGNSFLLYGMITGQGKSDNGTYTANVTDFFYTGVSFSGSISASNLPGSFNGTLSESGTTTSFTGTPLPPADPWDYITFFEEPATLSDITGTWTGSLLDGSAATVTINSDGTVSGTSAGCSFSGTVAADASNENFFDVSLTFGDSPCLFPNQTATGVGIDYLLPDNVTHQLLVAVNVGTAAGTVFGASR